MATTRKTITLTEQQDAWIKAKIAEGGYTNDSEYIRDLIRRDQHYEVLRQALVEGEESGAPTAFDPDAFKKRMMHQHG